MTHTTLIVEIDHGYSARFSYKGDKITQIKKEFEAGRGHDRSVYFNNEFNHYVLRKDTRGVGRDSLVVSTDLAGIEDLDTGADYVKDRCLEILLQDRLISGSKQLIRNKQKQSWQTLP
jgi:hypothetical protein